MVSKNPFGSRQSLLTTVREEFEQEDYFKCPHNELLIWAVLMKRHKMAMFVCERGGETLAKVRENFCNQGFSLKVSFVALYRLRL